MIKNKITPETKNKFFDTIKKTIETGKEYGLSICIDDKNKLISKEICEGEDCYISLDPFKDCLPYRAQGNFHVHPNVAIVREMIGDKHEKIPKEIIVDSLKEIADSEGVELITPSHRDLLNTLIHKCLKRSEGTVCIGSDAVLGRVDCYTANDKITEDDCKTSKLQERIDEEKTRKSDSFFKSPKSWIKPLFDKEIIYLRKA